VDERGRVNCPTTFVPLRLEGMQEQGEWIGLGRPSQRCSPVAPRGSQICSLLARSRRCSCLCPERLARRASRCSSRRSSHFSNVGGATGGGATGTDNSRIGENLQKRREHPWDSGRRRDIYGNLNPALVDTTTTTGPVPMEKDEAGTGEARGVPVTGKRRGHQGRSALENSGGARRKTGNV
jgi:hypothetical protein